MSLISPRAATVSFAFLILAFSSAGVADDSAASIAAGGLVSRREPRIVMAKEVLSISEKKVAVDYDFRNDTNEDVTTEVAFPVPPYTNEYPEGDQGDQAFRSFRLWVDGQPVQYQVDARATLEGEDVSETLRANQIDIPTLGHFIDTEDANHNQHVATEDFVRLPKAEREKLVEAGLFDDQGGTAFALWTAHVQYHWTQRFPAHSTVHIRHEYTPVEGTQLLQAAALRSALTAVQHGPAAAPDPELRGDLTLLAGFCAERDVLSSLARRTPAGTYLSPRWVDFILTTANTWRQPIEDFTLIVERGQPENGSQIFVSFCSPQNAKVEKLDADRFKVHLKNFIPAAELHIGFFEVPLAEPARPGVKR